MLSRCERCRRHTSYGTGVCHKCERERELEGLGDVLLDLGQQQSTLELEEDAKWMEEAARKLRMPVSNEERTKRMAHYLELSKLAKRARATTKIGTVFRWNTETHRFETVLSSTSDRAYGPSLDHARTIRDLVDPDSPVVIDPSIPKKFGVR